MKHFLECNTFLNAIKGFRKVQIHSILCQLKKKSKIQQDCIATKKKKYQTLTLQPHPHPSPPTKIHENIHQTRRHSAQQSHKSFQTYSESLTFAPCSSFQKIQTEAYVECVTTCNMNFLMNFVLNK